MEIIKLIDEKAVITELCNKIQECATKAIQENDIFLIGLSGGSLIKYLCTGLPNITTDWSKWKLFFCDERFVSVGDADSTFGAYKSGLLSQVPIKESQFVTIKMDCSLSESAQDYEDKIMKIWEGRSNSIPSFDLLLLGMGPDGHTCSLFPGHPLLSESKLLIAPIADSPKPPPERITMTYPLINNAKCCIFAMSGIGKAEMVKRILTDHEQLPAGMVKPSNGKLYWILDNAAGSLLA